MLPIFAAILVASGTPPPRPKLDLEGWQYLDVSSDAETLVASRPGSSPGWLWVRFEFKSPYVIGAKSYGSTMSLYEADCVGERLRTHKSMNYPRANIGGVPDSLDFVSAWAIVAPTTLGESIFQRACGREPDSSAPPAPLSAR